MTAPLALFNHGPIRQIRLARPPVNALDTELCRALIGAIEQAHSDGVQGIVLSGGEGIFSAGMDVPELMAHGDDRAGLLQSWQAFFGAVRAIGHSRIPVAVAIGGHCPAGGCVLSLAADYRIMAASSSLADDSRWVESLHGQCRAGSRIGHAPLSLADDKRNALEQATDERPLADENLFFFHHVIKISPHLDFHGSLDQDWLHTAGATLAPPRLRRP